ncbi:hypothetical protein SDC9_168936 [bioreactor metagenome]|uniref:Uncharacterized protein n=1 Tax=bioreactor metagenome TaxID=1076179 RepID=A0A645G603_9ZZZZ
MVQLERRLRTQLDQFTMLGAYLAPVQRFLCPVSPVLLQHEVAPVAQQLVPALIVELESQPVRLEQRVAKLLAPPLPDLPFVGLARGDKMNRPAPGIVEQGQIDGDER